MWLSYYSNETLNSGTYFHTHSARHAEQSSVVCKALRSLCCCLSHLPWPHLTPLSWQVCVQCGQLCLKHVMYCKGKVATVRLSSCCPVRAGQYGRWGRRWQGMTLVCGRKRRVFSVYCVLQQKAKKRENRRRSEEKKVTKKCTKEGLFLKQSQATPHIQALIPIAPHAAEGMLLASARGAGSRKSPSDLNVSLVATRQTPGGEGNLPWFLCRLHPEHFSSLPRPSSSTGTLWELAAIWLDCHIHTGRQACL